MGFRLKCRDCGYEYNPELRFICEECFGALEVVYEFKELKIDEEELRLRKKNLWRYKEVLPLSFYPEQFQDIGFTPLYKASNLSRILGIKEIYIKNDTLNPTGSFKDRPASVAISKCLEFNLKAIGASSTGNLAASLAALSSRIGLPCFVLIPSKTELNKIVQAITYGSKVLLIDGNYDQLNFITIQLAEKGIYGFANVNLRPYYAEGSKTLAYEIAEQLGWDLPDKIIIPMASGALLCMIWKGIKELIELKLVEKRKVSLIGVQPRNCNPIVNGFRTGEFKSESCETIAKSLAISTPADGRYAVKAIRESEGLAIDVSDEEIINAMKVLAKKEGLFAEPAGAISTAALINLAEEGYLSKDERVVCLMTGSGFKSVEIFEGEAEKLKGELIEPSLKKVEDILKSFVENG